MTSFRVKTLGSMDPKLLKYNVKELLQETDIMSPFMT